MDTVKRTERGWPGHFICSSRCVFHRNTLLEYKEVKIVVSTVGMMVIDGKPEPIGFGRNFETMAFHAFRLKDRYWDADVERQIDFSSPWAISELDADDRANDMHEVVVEELTTRLLAGEFDS